MAETDPKVDAFYNRAEAWRDELLAFRAILLSTPLTEEFKWRGPCYTFDGGNIATLWGLKDSCTLGFFKGVLLSDPQGLLEPPGENSRSARVFRVTTLAEITRNEDAIRALIDEAIAAEKAGLKVDLPKDDLDWPDELHEALDADPEMRAAFDALTPGRQRGYILHFSQPKQSQTRARRIEKAAPRILDGKGMHDR